MTLPAKSQTNPFFFATNTQYPAAKKANTAAGNTSATAIEYFFKRETTGCEVRP